MTSTKPGLLVAGLMLLSISVTACGSGSGSSGSDTTIALLEIQDLTGVGGNLGTESLNGSKTAIEVINDAGGVLGKKLVLIAADDASQAAQSVSLMQKYGPDKSITAIVGPTYSADFIADSPFAEKYGVPIISAGSTAPWPGNFNKWTFRSSAPGSAYLDKLVTAAVADGSIKTVAQMWATDNPALDAQAKQLDKIFPQHGVTVVSDQTATNATTNFNSQVASIMAKHPDLVTIGLITSGTANFTQQMRAAGYKGDFMAIGSTLNDPSLSSVSQGAADGLIVPTSFDPNSTAPQVQTFVAAFKKKFNRIPNGQEAFGYDAVAVIADAIKRADSTDRDAVRDALGTTQGFVGAQGPFTYDGSGDNKTPAVYIIQLTSKGFVPYRGSQ